MSKNRVETTWREYWKDNVDAIKYDVKGADLSSLIFEETLNNLLHKPLDRQSVIECGSGSGRISALVAGKAKDTMLLDIVEPVVAKCKRLFKEYNLKGKFIVGDILNMPIKNNMFDLVWNSGVLEHFIGSERQTALENMKRVCVPGGLMLIFTPSRKALFYRFGKWVMEKRGCWPYGDEYPVDTLYGECKKAGLVLRKEYQKGFIHQESYLRGGLMLDKISFINALVMLFSLRIIQPLLLRLRWLDEILTRVFGGYLLVSVISKPSDATK